MSVINLKENIKAYSNLRRPQKEKGYIQLFTLVLFALSSALFPRVLTLLKFPPIITLLHFAIVPCICAVTLFKTKVKERNQILVVGELLVALVIFLGINIASALWNNAGAINAFLNFLFLCEHFLLLLAIISIPLTPERLRQFRAYIVFASLLNLFFAYFQQYVLGLGDANPDYIQGIFYLSGAGHVIGASMSMTFAVYVFAVAKNLPLWLRSCLVLAAFWHMNLADAKQVLLVFLVSAVILILIKFKKIAEALQYLLAAVVIGYAIYWTIYNIPSFEAFLTWARPEIYGPEGEATLLKTATFRIIPTFYDSPLDPWIGLGPGHTVGRLGGWMLKNYWYLLGPLGATVHSATNSVWTAVGESWLGDQSSMFSPLFGWAGIWGDLGIFGLGSFLYIWYIVWRRLCLDDISRFLVINVFVFGFVFSQMEEPAYMLFVASIIGLQWQQHQIKAKKRRVSLDSNASTLNYIK